MNAPRPVRVTIEGELRRATKRRSLLVFTGGSLLLKDGLADVTVEHLTQPRVWTAGDVLLVESDRPKPLDGALPWTRDITGRWASPDVPGVFCDTDMDCALDSGRATILRQQASA